MMNRDFSARNLDSSDFHKTTNREKPKLMDIKEHYAIICNQLNQYIDASVATCKEQKTKKSE